MGDGEGLLLVYMKYSETESWNRQWWLKSRVTH